MSDAVDRATMLRNQALAQRNKVNARVSTVVIRAKIAEFLNSTESYQEHVENLWPSIKPTQAVSRLRSLIKEDGLDELVYPIHTPDGGATLVKLS